MSVRHMFAGVNSPYGFYSNFNFIADDAKCKRKVYLKGGPGTGKSTLIKKILSEAEDDGYDCELFHCSSDAQSADGLYLPQLRTAVVDATAPHSADPTYPGFTGEIYNAGEYINHDKLLEDGEKILFYNDEKRAAFRRAYSFLSAAGAVLSNICENAGRRMDPRCISIESERLVKKLFGNIDSAREGNVRKLFLSAVCPDGFVNFAESLFASCNVVAIKGCWGPPLLVERIMHAALYKGLDVEAYYCPLNPSDRVEHIIIPEIKVAFTTYNYYHHYVGDEIIDLEYYHDGKTTEGLDEDCIMAEQLLERAVVSLTAAKEAHRFLERIYTPAMDFTALERSSRALIKNIFE